MEFRQIEIFRAVAEMRSFTRAGERLGLTQSAVSQQIRALEEELGEPLLVRTSRRVEVSRAGELVLEHADRISSELSAIKAAFKGGETLAASRLRVAAATQALVHLFSPTFAEFIRRYPQVELSFRTTANTNETIGQVRSNAADVGFASLPIRSRELKIERLFDDDLILAVNPDHRFAHRSSVQPGELASERFVIYEQNLTIRQMTDAFFEQAQLSPSVAVESNDTDFIVRMVRSGIGISFLPAWAVSEEIQNGTLKGIAVDGYHLQRSVAIMCLKSGPPAAVRVFLAFMRQHQESIQRAAQPQLIPSSTTRPQA